MFRALLAVACLGVVVRSQLNVDVDLNIYPCPTLLDDVQNCQNGANALPFSDFPYGVTADVRNVAYLFISGILPKACAATNKAKFRSVAKCVIGAYRHCGDNDFKTLVMTPEQFGQVFDLLCSDVATYTQIFKCLSSSYLDCVRNRKARQAAYAYRPNIGSSFGHFADFYCGQSRIESYCVLNDDDVQSCFPAGANEKYKQVKTITKPEACGI